LVVDAQSLPFPDKSIRAIYGINCFHHFPSPQLFFSELDRVLVPGGGCVLIEPYYGPFAGFLWKRLFDTEHFNKEQRAWDGDASTMGAMSGANIATSYIIFKRDRSLFEERYPSLEIVTQEPISNYVRYLMSGALNFRPLVPTFMEPVLRLAEFCLKPLAGLLAIQYTIVLRKKKV
jgi:SAM-dependent methyltransferase